MFTTARSLPNCCMAAKRAYMATRRTPAKPRPSREVAAGTAFINKRAYRNRPLTDQDRDTNRRKSSIRSCAEHIFGTVKGYFGFKKVRYRGIAKNENCLNVLFALSNLFMSKKKLLRLSTA